MLAALWNRLSGYIVAASVMLFALLGAYLRGRSVGKAIERDRREAHINRQANKARQEVRHVQDEVARTSDDAIAHQLKSDWLRKPTRRR